MPDKLTDSEIVKALECCPKNIICGECPLCGKKDCMNKLYINALDLINRLQAENERLREPASASAIHILAEKAVEALLKENEEHKTEIMRLEHNVRVLSENSIIAKYPHHWLLDEGWFLSKELDGYGKFKAQVSNDAVIGFVGRLKAKAEVFPELRLIVIKEKDWDNLLKEFGGSEV